MGGTGKSVVVAFLVRTLRAQHSAIVLRGYGGLGEKSKHSLLVSDGRTVLVTRQQSGDEAMMHARALNVPVVVGKNRAQSCLLLESRARDGKYHIDYVILDDAYQNFDVQKNCEILLLDGRAPFDNGHCLPVGRLRETDYHRADIIIITHANMLSQTQRLHIRQTLLHDFDKDHIFMGAHVPHGIFYHNQTPVQTDDLKDKRFFVCAGVGSFSGVLASVKQCGVIIGDSIQFGDHHEYTIRDIKKIIDGAQMHHCDGIVTTAKDWVKLEPLLSQCVEWRLFPWHVLRVEFEFLSSHEYDNFMNVLRHMLEK